METRIDTSSRDLVEQFAKLKKTEGWRRALDVLNAEAVKKDLAAVWEGIERAMKRHKVIFIPILCIFGFNPRKSSK